MRAQRALLNQIGSELGQPVVFIKAARADAVLYGAQGERYGTDIDVSVPSSAFDAVANALQDRGFRAVEGLNGARGAYFELREKSFSPPAGSAYLSVDLHRILGDDCWVDYPPGELFGRAKLYESPQGQILSLSPEDQVVYAYVHHTVHAFDLDERHLLDTVRLIDQFPIDWHTVVQRAKKAGQLVTLTLLLKSMQGLGTRAPLVEIEWRYHQQARLVRAIIGHDGIVSRGIKRGRMLDYFAVRPLLSDNLSAPTKFAIKHGIPWLIEAARTRKSDLANMFR